MARGASPAPGPEVTERQIQEDMVRLDAYRSQFNALAQQREILLASRQEHLRARESLEGIDRSHDGDEMLVPLGGEAFVRGTVARSTPILIGVGSGVVAEMERPKAVELIASRLTRIEQAIRDVEGQLTAVDERVQLLSRRLEALSHGPGATGDVGGA